MKISKKTHKQLCESMGNVLIKIGSDEFTDDELDNILEVMLTFLGDMKKLDVSVVKEHKEYLKDKKLLKIEEQLNRRLDRMKNNRYTKEVHERLYKHFDTQISENTEKQQDISLEVQTKYLVPDRKLYYEQQKVLLTMLSSNICTQNETDEIKEKIEEGRSFTTSIQEVIKNKSELTKIKNLCRLQDQRFNDDIEKQKRLY